MLTYPILFESACPVCKGVIHYPDERACNRCGWVLVLSTKPSDAESLRRLEELQRARSKKFTESAGQTEKLQRLKEQLAQWAPAFEIQKARLEELRAKMAELTAEKQQLLSSPVFTTDLDAVEKTVQELDRQRSRLMEKIPAQRPHINPGVAVRCSYIDADNKIKVEIIRVRNTGLAAVELFLGLAISSQPFAHYSEAEIVIPVKNRTTPIKVSEQGEIYLELMQQPEKSATHHTIIHLYPNTITQFTIE